MHNQLFSKQNSIFAAAKRILFAIAAIFTYIFIHKIKYPGISTHEDYSSSILFSSATSILGQSIRPVIITELIMGIISIISKDFENMRKSASYKKIFDISSIIIILTISFLMSAAYVKTTINYVDFAMRNNFFIKYTLINMISSMFVLFFNRQILTMGTGSGTSFMISIQIISDLLRTTNILSEFKYFIYFLLVFFIASIMEGVKIYMPIYALKSESSKAKESDSYLNIENRPLNNCVMSNILATQFMMIFSRIISSDILSELLGGTVLFFKKHVYIQSIIYNLSYVLLIILFSYINAFAYSNNSTRISTSVRQSLCIFVNSKVGQEQQYIERVSLFSALISGICTMIAIYTPGIVSYFFQIKALDGIKILIIVNSLAGIITFSQSVYYYTTYTFPSHILIKKK